MQSKFNKVSAKHCEHSCLPSLGTRQPAYTILTYGSCNNCCFQLSHNYYTYLCRGFSPPWFSCSAIDSNNKLGYRIIARTASHFNVSSINVHIAVCKCGRTDISFPRTKISRTFTNNYIPVVHFIAPFMWQVVIADHSPLTLTTLSPVRFEHWFLTRNCSCNIMCIAMLLH